LKAGVICLLFLLMLPAVLFADDYVIGDGDGLQIAVWGEPAVSTGATVRPDGKITLPGIGDVVASGFTPMALSANLSEKLRKMVKEPIVTVTVTHITNNKIYVFGGGVVPAGNVSAGGNSSGGSDTAESILSSGVYPLPGRTTLLKFLSGLGMLRSADLSGAYIIRQGKKLDVDFYDLFIKADLSRDIALKADDMIYIPDNTHNKIYVMGAVNKPTAIPYWRGMKILDIILDAGGFTKFARENSVLILRKVPGKEATKDITVKVGDLMKDGDLSQNIPLMPGDFVIIKEGIF
jgi:polysaccharide export outer membrane protein